MRHPHFSPPPVGHRHGRSVEMTRLWNRLLAGIASEKGQGTVEYFLVILAATALAMS